MAMDIRHKADMWDVIFMYVGKILSFSCHFNFILHTVYTNIIIKFYYIYLHFKTLDQYLALFNTYT